MNKQDNQETNNQQPLTEDLDVNEGQAAGIIGEIFGGGSEMKWDCVTNKPWRG